MRGPGILWMLQVGAGLSMAGPMFIIGFEFVRTGRPVFGVILFACGIIALFAPSYFIKRIGGPRTWVRRRLDRRGASEGVTEDESETEGEGKTQLEASGDGGLSRYLERIRRE